MFSLMDACKILGVGEYTLKRWVDENRIKCAYIDDQIYFDEKDVNDFIKRTGIKLVNPDDQFDKMLKEFGADKAEILQGVIDDLLTHKNDN